MEKMITILNNNHKQILINTSASIEGKTKEKVRSGQSYLYKKQGKESDVFEIRMVDAVRGDALNQTLLTTMQRYPYFNAKLVEVVGGFYLVQNNQSLLGHKSKDLPQLGGLANGYHLLAATYAQASIYVSFHHALWDGKGIKPFIETLIYYYCLLRYQSTASRAGICLASDALLEGETVEPFLEPYDYDQGKNLIQIYWDGFVEMQGMMTYSNNMVFNSYVISYLGQFVLNENAQHVDSIHLYNSGVVGFGINMICATGQFSLDFKQSFASDKYIQAFVEKLSLLNLPYTLANAIPFITPKDPLMRR